MAVAWRRLVLLAALTLTAWLPAAPPRAAGAPDGGFIDLVEVNAIPLPLGHVRAVCLQGQRAFVAQEAGGLGIIDVSDPARPRVLGRWITGNLGRDSIDREWVHTYRGRATAVAVAPSGRFAYLLTQSKGYDLGRTKVLRIDVGNVANPVPAGEFLLAGTAPTLLALDDTHVAVAGPMGGSGVSAQGVFCVIDFAEAGRERVAGALGSLPATKEAPADRAGLRRAHLARGGDAVVLAGTMGGAKAGVLYVLNLGNAAAPACTGSTAIGPPPLDVVADPAGKCAYVLTVRGLYVVDISNRQKPGVVGQCAMTTGVPVALAAVGQRVDVLSTGGVDGFNISDADHPKALGGQKWEVGPAETPPGRAVPRGQPVDGQEQKWAVAPRAMAVNEQLMVVADEHFGLGTSPRHAGQGGGWGAPAWLPATSLILHGGSGRLDLGSTGALPIDTSTAGFLKFVVSAEAAVTAGGGDADAALAQRREWWAAGPSAPAGPADDDDDAPDPLDAGGETLPAIERGRCVEGNLIYAAVSYHGLRIYDATDPAAPKQIGELTIPVTPRTRDRMNPRAVAVQGKIAYLVTGRDGLRTIDVSNPRAPVLLGRFYDTQINRMAISDIKVRGGRAYLADLDNGLYVLDVHDPAHPTMLARYHTGNAHGVELVDNLAIVADGVFGLLAIDTSAFAPTFASTSETPIDKSQIPNPKSQILSAPAPAPGNGTPPALRRVGRYHARNLHFTAVAALPRERDQDPTILVADAGALRTFRLKPSATPPLDEGPIELVSHVKVPMGIPNSVRVAADGKYAYLAGDEGWNFTIVDLADMAKPAMAGVAATSGFCHGLAIQGHLAYVCNNYDACTIFELADPAHPTVAGAILGLNHCRKAEVLGGLLALRTSEGIVLYDLKDPVNPQRRAAVAGMSDEYALADVGGRRYLLGPGTPGWQVFDVTDPARPQRIGALAGEGFGATAVRGDLAFITHGNEIVSARFGAQPPQVVGKLGITTLGRGEVLGRLSVDGDTLYAGGDALFVIDVSHPEAPRLLSTLHPQVNEGTYSGPVVADVAAFTRDGRPCVAIADFYWGLRFYDARDKAQLRPISDFHMSGGDYTGIQATGRRAYVSNNWGGVYTVDTRDPLHPRILGTTANLTTPNHGSSSGLVVGHTLYFQGNTDYVLRIADVADPGDPRLLGDFKLPRPVPRVSDDRRFGSAFPQYRDQYLYTPGLARIFDVSDPADPRLAGSAPEVGFENGSCILTDVAGQPYLVLCNSAALKVVDVSQPKAPKLVGTLPGDYDGGYYFGRGIRADGPTVYVLNKHQFNTVDISNPARPRRLASLELTGFNADVKVVDGLAYVATYYDGLEVVDVRDPRNPVPVDHFQQGVYWDDAGWDNIACYECLDAADGYLYVGEYYSGMEVLKMGGSGGGGKLRRP